MFFFIFCRCTTCSERFMSPEKLNAHKETKHNEDDEDDEGVDKNNKKEKLFKCDQCDETFNRLHLLNRHLSMHGAATATEQKPTRITNVQKRKKHNEKLRQIFLMDCEFCDLEFDCYRQAIEHYQTEHNQDGYLRCCNRKFYKLEKMLDHCDWHIDPKRYKCTLCAKLFKGATILRKHIESKHALESELTFKCDICDKRFLRESYLTAHLKLYHIPNVERQFECYQCGFRFLALNSLRVHVRSVHDNVCNYVCDICAKQFRSPSAYKYHTDLVHSKKNISVQCDQCGRWMKHQKTLESHMKSHTDNAPATCPQCGKVSSNRRALKLHIRHTHTEPKFSCSICSRKFKRKILLKEHIYKIHAGRFDMYSCEFCARPFASNVNMYKHRRRSHPVEVAQSRAKRAANKYCVPNENTDK